MIDVGTLSREHPAWQILARRAGAAPPTWHARPQDGQDPWTGWDGPGVLTAATAGELDALIGQADG